MKNIYKKVAILSVGLSMVFTACKDAVDILPTDSIETTKAYESVADLDKGTIGAYSAFLYENSIWTAAYMSDEVRWAADNVARNYGLEHKWAFDASTGNATAAWANLYAVIDRANRALAATDVIAVSGAQIAMRDRIKGELLAIRAFAHFELLRNYALKYEASSPGVPIMLTSGITTPARNTWAEVISFVKGDLALAKTLIPTSYTVADYSRITNVAVSAMQARVALYNKDWDNAITFATEVINARPLATRAVYPNIWTDASTTEVLFRLGRTTTTVNTLWTDTNKDVFFSPSYKLINTFDQTNDIRYNTFIKVDNTVPANREKIKVNKYPGQSASLLYNHTKVLRTSEMYLIRAEAHAQKGSLGLAAADVFTLRSNRITGAVLPVYLTQAAAIADIDLERFKELAFEGHRFYDLKRRGVDIVRDAADLTTATNIPQTLKTTDRNYVLPLPAAEILANPNISQAPGY